MVKIPSAPRFGQNFEGKAYTLGRDRPMVDIRIARGVAELYFRHYEFAAQSLRERPRQEPRQSCPADAAGIHRAHGGGVSAAGRGDPWHEALHVAGDLRA